MRLRLRTFFAGLIAPLVIMTAAIAAQAGTVYTFEDGTTNGWFDGANGWDGGITNVASGTNGITAFDGARFAVLTGGQDTGPFTRFGAYDANWNGGFVASAAIYLDTSWALGQGLEWDVAACDSLGGFLRDFIFHITRDTSTGLLLVGASNNSNFAPREDLESINHYSVTSSGWYQLQQVFYDNGGLLAVDMNLRDASGNVLWTETRNPGDLIANMGGHRYGWNVVNTVSGGVAFDNVGVSAVPLPSAAIAGLGLLGGLGVVGAVRRQRRNAIAA